MVYKISGSTTENSTIVVINEANWSIETTSSGVLGSFELSGLVNGKKIILARNQLGRLSAVGDVDPIAELITNYATLNPADKHAGITLSENDTLGTRVGTANEFEVVRATNSNSTGKWYFEAVCTAQGGANMSCIIGFCTNSNTLYEYPGNYSTGWGYHLYDGDVYNAQNPLSYGYPTVAPYLWAMFLV